jgi:hypothetical protein
MTVCFWKPCNEVPEIAISPTCMSLTPFDRSTLAYCQAILGGHRGQFSGLRITSHHAEWHRSISELPIQKHKALPLLREGASASRCFGSCRTLNLPITCHNTIICFHGVQTKWITVVSHLVLTVDRKLAVRGRDSYTEWKSSRLGERKPNESVTDGISSRHAESGGQPRRITWLRSWSLK